jgi:hypothetical protein
VQLAARRRERRRLDARLARASIEGVIRQALLGDGRKPSNILTRTAVFLVGAAFVVMSAMDLREAARLEPKALTCAEWLQAPRDTRWVALTGCHLDLQMASSRRWKGFWFGPVPDGGSRAKLLELFVPLSASDTRELPVRAVVATSDPDLLSRLDEIARLDVSEVAAFLEAHRAELQARLEPEVLTGYVEPVPSVASRAALNAIEADDTAAVVVKDREPPRANGIFGLLLGAGAMVGAAWRVVHRYRRLRRGEPLDDEDDE